MKWIYRLIAGLLAIRYEDVVYELENSAKEITFNGFSFHTRYLEQEAPPSNWYIITNNMLTFTDGLWILEEAAAFKNKIKRVKFRVKKTLSQYDPVAQTNYTIITLGYITFSDTGITISR